jgi:hypothetical protein
MIGGLLNAMASRLQFDWIYSESYLQPKGCKGLSTNLWSWQGLEDLSTCIMSLAKLGSYYPVATVGMMWAIVL